MPASIPSNSLQDLGSHGSSNSQRLPKKKAGIPDSTRSFLHSSASVVTPEQPPHGTGNSQPPTEQRGSKSRVLFLGETQRKNQTRIWEDPPTFVLGNHRQQLGAGDIKIRGNQHQTRSQNSMYRSVPGARPAPDPAALGALSFSPGNAALPYPSPTSRDIITTKPRMEVQEANFPLPLVWASGMMSSITT